VVERADGTRVIRIGDANGYAVRRCRIAPEGREIVLFDDIRWPKRSARTDRVA
jgi:hypothetical protein